MDPVTGSLIVGGAGALLGLAGTSSTNASNKEIAEMNIAMQKETNAQNEALMRESWGRDDNAVQRRAKDLAAAGMSPLLAAGAAATNSGPVSMSAPQSKQVVQRSGLEGAVSGLYQGMMAQQSVMDMLARQQQILINQGSLAIQAREQENRNKSTDLSNALATVGLKYEDQTRLAQIMKTYADAEAAKQGTQKTGVETKQAAYDFDISKKWGLRKTDQPDLTLRKAEQIINAMQENFSGLNFVGAMRKKLEERR